MPVVPREVVPQGFFDQLRVVFALQVGDDGELSFDVGGEIFESGGRPSRRDGSCWSSGLGWDGLAQAGQCRAAACHESLDEVISRSAFGDFAFAERRAEERDAAAEAESDGGQSDEHTCSVIH